MSTKQQKAQELMREGKVQQVNADTFVVHGSGSKQYEVKENHDSMYNYNWYCKCPAWKFDNTRECKHVLAVEIFKSSVKNAKANANPQMTKAQAQAVSQMKARQAQAQSGIDLKQNGNKQYKVRKAKEKCNIEIENKGKDGKNKPLRFDKDGKLIIQYTDKVEENDFEDEQNRRRRRR